MLETFIETRNYSKLREALTRLENLPETAPKIGLGYGNFGLGKTFALERIAAHSKQRTILLSAAPTWSVVSVLKKLCYELGVTTSYNATETFDNIVEELTKNPCVIIIDEVDTLLQSRKFAILETLRAIHDSAPIVLFFIGMEEAVAKLKRYSHYYSRVVEFVEFKNIGGDDIKKFCEQSDKVKIEDDLIEYFAKRYPNLRQIRVLLIRLEDAAKRNNVTSCNLKTFRDLKIEEVGKA